MPVDSFVAHDLQRPYNAFKFGIKREVVPFNACTIREAKHY